MASFDPKTTLVVMALADESQGLFEKVGIHPLYTGIGQVRAAYSITKALCDHKPKAILNLGTAGSFHLKQGDLVECSGFVQRNSKNGLAGGGLRTKAIQVANPLTNLPKVICGTGDFIQEANLLTLSNLTQNLQKNFEIMDMEAYALAYVAQQMNIPFYSIKYISDNSNAQTASDWKKNSQEAAQNLLNIYLGL